jgi:putative Mg2+ transporter-C (MgtC) family protein
MTKYIIQLLLAVLLGSLIGLEREMKRKKAGLRTYSLVCLGSCLFTMIALNLGEAKVLDASPILMAVAVGMGFIGAGAIFKEETQIIGLTTAAGLWTTSAIGLAVGAELYSLAIFSTFLVLAIFLIFGYLEDYLLR